MHFLLILHCLVYQYNVLEMFFVSIDNHDSGYLEMVVQLYVQAHLGHYHNYLDPEGIQSKTNGTAEIYNPFYLYICMI